MTEIVKNKSNKNLKTYITLTNSKQNTVNDSKKINQNEIYFIGKNNNSDLFINGKGDYINFSIYKVDDNKVNSWIIFDKKTKKIISYKFKDYNILVNEKFIEIKNKNKSHKYILIICLILIILLIFGLILFWIYMQSDNYKNNDSSPTISLINKQIIPTKPRISTFQKQPTILTKPNTFNLGNTFDIPKETFINLNNI